FFLGQRPRPSAGTSTREIRRGTTDATDCTNVEKKIRRSVSYESQKQAAKIFDCTHTFPPCSIRDIRVIRGYFLYAGTSGSSGGSRPSSSSSFNGSPAGITFTVILEVLLSDQA